jgi:hypothetical protein
MGLPHDGFPQRGADPERRRSLGDVGGRPGGAR